LSDVVSNSVTPCLPVQAFSGTNPVESSFFLRCVATWASSDLTVTASVCGMKVQEQVRNEEFGGISCR
jgi:hypothetical protein